MLSAVNRLMVVVAATLVLGYCRKPVVAPVQGVVLRKVEAAQWPLMTDTLPVESMLRAVDAQLAWLAQKPAYRWTVADREVTGTVLTDTLRVFREVFARHHGDPTQLTHALKERFDLYRFTFNAGTDILITGYHAPVYSGSMTRDATFRFPLYARPDDLVHIETERFSPSVLQKPEAARRGAVPARVAEGRVLPYYTREEIDGPAQVLAGRDLELVYLDDYFRAFAFHVQGGGFVRLQDGRYLKFDYAGSNGQPYVSIGKRLVADGKIPLERISMQALGEWFRTHPEDLEPVCFLNPSFVFYRTNGVTYEALLPEHFPNGVLGFPVTTRRTIATDKRHFPGGGLAFIEGRQRAVSGAVTGFSAFVVDQDTGGAIRDNHIDWFLGAGPEAEHDAGLLMDGTGDVYFLLLKNVAL